MFSKDNSLTSWLMQSVEDGSISGVTKALFQKANPTLISEEHKKNALHLAVEKGNVAIFTLLASNNLADLNTVDMQFRPSIIFAHNLMQNKKEMIKSIILHRRPINSDLLDQYIFTCVNAFSKKGNPRESDFALLAHYVSRLCGVHVGKLINSEHNDDRYLIHLSQYSGAKKYNEAKARKIGLEGWSAHEFLPIRIFSLFEILVKLEQGSILVEEKENWCVLLRKEILTELETFKIEQERRAIAKSTNFSNAEREFFYEVLAEKLLKNILNNPNEEYTLFGGYQGHAIYVSFIFNKEQNELSIRYDNLGNGTKGRHVIDNGVIYPRIVKTKIVNEKSIVTFVKELFSIKSKELPEEPEEPEKSAKPQGSKDEKYYAAKERYKKELIEYDKTLDKIEDIKDELLENFYDDKNNLNAVDVSSEQFGLPRQQADTCVATSHQVGLLLRLQDRSFYEWVLAEEKRCIVQPNRNQGSLQLDDPQFWNDTWSVFKSPEFSDCCPIKPINDIKNNPDMISLVIHRQEQQKFHRTKGDFDRAFNENSYEGFKLFFQNYILKDESPLVFSALTSLKLGLEEKALVDKFRFFNISMIIFKEILKFNINSPAEPYIHYFLGLIYYNLSQFESSKLSFEKCYNLLVPILKAQENAIAENQSNRSFYNPFLDNERSEIKDYQVFQDLKKKAHIASGFIKIELKKYDAAFQEFEQTCVQTDTKNGMRYIGWNYKTGSKVS